MDNTSIKYTITSILIIFCITSTNAQYIDDFTFGTDTTFDVATWNIEWFPKNGQTTVNYVTGIIDAMNVDILAIQEVDDVDAFNQMMNNGLNAYEGYLESLWFAGLAYIYNPETIQINDIYEIYTSSPYWSAFPRSPMVMDLKYNNERIIVINNHFKCCGDGIMDLNDSDDEETRRYFASNYLKEYIDDYFPDENVIVLGDLNDDLTDNYANNVFRQILNDQENYLFTDLDIANGSSTNWSYPTYPSHLDHILITNELFDEFANDSAVIETIRIDDYLQGGWDEYEEFVSDHRPVGLKVSINSNLNINLYNNPEFKFYNYPNPVINETTFSIPHLNGVAEVVIYHLYGKEIETMKVPSGQTCLKWKPKGIPAGVYFSQLLIEKHMVATAKILISE